MGNPTLNQRNIYSVVINYCFVTRKLNEVKIKTSADKNKLADLKNQVAEYEQRFKLRRAEFYKEYKDTSGDDWDSAINLAKADGSWYDY